MAKEQFIENVAKYVKKYENAESSDISKTDINDI